MSAEGVIVRTYMEAREPPVRAATGQAKPAGGYVLAGVPQLCTAWWAYRAGHVRLADLRAYFACLEMTARRCGLREGRHPRYGLDELRGLTAGAGTTHLRRSLGRLGTLGLLRWSPSSITFAAGPDELTAPDLAGLREMVGTVENNRRRVPVPRRVLRLMAGRDATCGLIAAVLGHLMRGLYYRAGLCVPYGACKASWVADVFRVDERSVTRARAALVAAGWLKAEEREQWYLNRFGWRYTIDLSWAGGEVVSARSGLPDPVPLSTADLPAPGIDREPFPEEGSSHQKPGTDRPGVWNGEETEPTLRHVVPADLANTRRLLTLFRDGVGKGLVNGSEASRLSFVALAEHARTIGGSNPPGLFASLVRRGLFHYATAGDEEAARRRLRLHLDAPGGPAPPGLPTPVRAVLTGVLSRLSGGLPTTEFPLGPLSEQGRGETANLAGCERSGGRQASDGEGHDRAGRGGETEK
jgi:hypothetical protein